MVGDLSAPCRRFDRLPEHPAHRVEPRERMAIGLVCVGWIQSPHPQAREQAGNFCFEARHSPAAPVQQQGKGEAPST